MARIYNQEDFGGSFRGSAKGGSYNPMKAYDPSKQLNEQTKRKVEDIKTLQRGAARQANVDSAQMQANQAKTNAKFGAIKGLMSMSKSFAAMAQANEQQQLRDEEETALFGELENSTEIEVEDNTTNEAIVASESAIQSVGGNDELLKDSIRHDQGKVVENIQIKKIGVYEASQKMDSFMQDFQFSTEEIVTPDGRVITPATLESQEDKNFALRFAFNKFAKENGLVNMDKEARQRVLMPKARQLMQQFSAAWGSNITNAKKERLLETAKTTAFTAIDSNEDLATAYQDLYTNLIASGNYIGDGKVDGGKAANDAFNLIVQKAIEDGDTDLLDTLASVEKVAGNKGTVFSKIKENELKQAKLKIAAAEIEEYKLIKANKSVDIKQASEERFEALLADNANAAEINEKTIAKLESIGGAEAIKEANRLKNLGVNYNPHLFQQMKDSGATYSEDQLIQLVQDQELTIDEAKKLGFTGTGVSKSEIANDKFKEFNLDKSIKSSIKGIIAITAKDERTGAEDQKQFIADYGLDIAHDASTRMENEMKQWMMDNPDDSPYDYLPTLKARYKEELESLTFDDATNTIKGYKFGGISTVQIGDTKHLNYGGLSFDELNQRKDLDPKDDILLTPKQMDTLKFVGLNKQGLATLSKTMMKRVEMLEKVTGTSIHEIYKGQLGMYGIQEKVKDVVKSTEITDELSTKYFNSELSEASLRAIGRPLTIRNLNNPDNKELRDKIIAYLENN